MFGYTTIDIKGEVVGMKFALPALQMIEEFMEDYEKKYSVVKIDNITQLSYAFYAGYFNNCIIKQSTPKFTFEDFYDRIINMTESDTELIQKAEKAFVDSFLPLFPKEDQEEFQKKNLKQTGTMLGSSASISA